MHGKSSFQGKVRVIAISLGIILIVGGCSSSHTGKENTQEAKEEYNVMPLGNSTYLLEGKNDFYSGLLMSVSEDQKTLIVSGLGYTDVYTMQ